ncbi:MAG: tyrosine-type recombinase/integrase [Candidatus Methylumidiphilus sp.]
MLSDIEARKAKPQDKPYKLTDGKGLYLLVNPNGGKLWRMNYRHDGKQKTLALGVYPEIALAKARERLEDARRLLANGIDPSAERKAVKQARQDGIRNAFEAVALEYFAVRGKDWSERHRTRLEADMRRDIFPWLGDRPIQDITAPELLKCLNRIVARGAEETARRAREVCGSVFRYGMATGRANADPSQALKGALPAANPKHHAAITEPKAVGELLRTIEGYTGSPIVRAALKLAPLVFLRPGELAQAEWAEFDLDAGEWRLPAERMKMDSKHIVPLSRQAVEILRDLRPLTGHQTHVFPHARNRGQSMSRESVRAALVRMGYGPDSDSPMTAHGFRGMASTLLHEQGWPSDMIERQLAHAERNKIKAAYNHAEHLPERRRMMQAWADYLDGLKHGAAVLPFRKQS